ncbi:MAG TPA: hypothetical protein VKX49_25455 [Bryobacteraceae bacterium]|nr:hypothetical protein [Bryobacteraceae bacterium]
MNRTVPNGSIREDSEIARCLSAPQEFMQAPLAQLPVAARLWDYIEIAVEGERYAADPEPAGKAGDRVNRTNSGALIHPPTPIPWGENPKVKIDSH